MAAFAAIALGLAACGDGEDEGISNARIVDALGLQEIDSGYAIDGDPFCEVEGKLLNDSGEVDTALEQDEEGFVIASRLGNVAIEAVPPFAPDCEEKARKALNRLDPKPKDE
ncbi:MAG: hypothetical protein ACRDKX_07405 [Solirubrobacterales bacterium]